MCDSDYKSTTLYPQDLRPNRTSGRVQRKLDNTTSGAETKINNIVNINGKS
jgi:hypothetical protein